LSQVFCYAKNVPNGIAYKANLDVNFINNANIKKGDYETAKIIFSNFIKMYDYHIFAYDCLRRIYKETGNRQKENEIFEQMIAVLASNKKAQSYRKYFNFLDNDIRKVLEKT
jgi:tetratricopeptide (TPR) repeat protein